MGEVLGLATPAPLRLRVVADLGRLARPSDRGRTCVQPPIRRPRHASTISRSSSGRRCPRNAGPGSRGSGVLVGVSSPPVPEPYRVHAPLGGWWGSRSARPIGSASRNGPLAGQIAPKARPDGHQRPATTTNHRPPWRTSTPAQLRSQPLPLKEPLIDPVHRPVVQRPLLPLLGARVRSLRRVDDDQLACDAAGFGEESPRVRPAAGGRRSGWWSVARRPGRGTEAGRRRPGRRGRAAALRGDLDHPRALVEADDVALQVPRQERGPAGDVERAGRRQVVQQARELLDLARPSPGGRALRSGRSRATSRRIRARAGRSSRASACRRRDRPSRAPPSRPRPARGGPPTARRSSCAAARAACPRPRAGR